MKNTKPKDEEEDCCFNEILEAARVYYDYIIDNDVDSVRLLILDGGVDPNIECDNRQPLCLACQSGSVDVIRLLLHECKIEVNRRNFYEETALHVAVKTGDITIIKLLLNAGARVNRGDSERVRPIHLAATLGRQDIIVLLVDYGAQVNSKDRAGNTVLHYALIHDNLELVPYLIGIGTKVNVADEAGNTPLMIAAIRGLGINVVDILLDAGADPNILNAKDRSPLFASIYHDYGDSVSLRLLDRQANPFILDKRNDNYTLLHYACIHGQYDIVRRLVDLGCDVDAASDHNETPVYLSVKRRFTHIVRYLISKGCNVNVMTQNTYDNYTPMHAAVSYYADLGSFIEVVDALIDAGANLTGSIVDSANDDREFRPLVLLSMVCRKFDFASYLIAIGCPVQNSSFMLGSALYRAYSIRRLNIMQEIYDAGVDLRCETWIKTHMYRGLAEENDFKKQILIEFMEMAGRPRLLTDICRIEIRDRLKNRLDGKPNLKRDIRNLGLACKQRSFLFMNFNPDWKHLDNGDDIL